MKRRGLSLLALAAAAMVSLPYAASAISAQAAQTMPESASQPPDSTFLSQGAAEVVKLSVAGFSEEVIQKYVKNCRSLFNLTAEGIVRLKEVGVSSTVISAMLAHDNLKRNQHPAQFSIGLQQQTAGTNMDLILQTPPPAPEDLMTTSPGPDYYWVPGYWDWNGGWIWISGGWCFHGGFGWSGHGWPGHPGWGWYGQPGGWGGHHGSHNGHGGGGFHGGGGHGGGHGGGGHGR